MSKAPRPRAHRRAHPSATVSTRPIDAGPGIDAIEVRTVCPHGAFRIGYALVPTVTERAAVCAAIFHHHAIEGCGCMRALWPRCRTEKAPADLDGLRDRFERLWSGVEDQQRRQGYAVIDWTAAVRELAGEVRP